MGFFDEGVRLQNLVVCLQVAVYDLVEVEELLVLVLMLKLNFIVGHLFDDVFFGRRGLQRVDPCYDFEFGVNGFG